MKDTTYVNASFRQSIKKCFCFVYRANRKIFLVHVKKGASETCRKKAIQHRCIQDVSRNESNRSCKKYALYRKKVDVVLSSAKEPI